MYAKRFMRKLVRKNFEYLYDPITGRRFFRNKVNDHSMWRKPRMLGREMWDPEDVREWGVEEVVFFLRKLGFAKFGYLENIKKYKIDGCLLLTFEWEDYYYIGMRKSMHIKRTLLNLQKRKFFAKHIDHPKDIQRRDRLRQHFNIDAAARLLQRKYRSRYQREMMSKLKDGELRSEAKRSEERRQFNLIESINKQTHTASINQSFSSFLLFFLCFAFLFLF
jgi:hypothetical protein